MKCPKELFEESLINTEVLKKENETVKILEKQMRDLTEKRNDLNEQITHILGVIDCIKNTRNTISFCEKEIAPLIDEAYNKHENRLYLPEFYAFTEYNRKVFCKLEIERRRYANGERSYTPTGETFDLEKFIEYLDQFCYKVEVKEHNYYKSYGRGYINTISLVITGISCV